MLIDRNTWRPANIRNRYRSVRAFSRGREVLASPPIEFIVEVTNHCNLRCLMCPRATMTRPQGFMDVGLFRSLVDQAKGSAELLYISGGLGEPLLHPRLGEMIAYCRSSGVRVGVSTNATLLDRAKAEMLLANPPNILLLSLDGATKETHEKVRIGSVFEKTMANVEGFLAAKTARGSKEPYTIAQMVYIEENEHEAEAFREKWRRNPAVDDVRMKRFLKLQGASYVPREQEAFERPAERSCILPWRQVSIAWDGKMSLCCRDLDFRHPVGSLAERPLAELWNSAAMTGGRKLLAAGKKAQIPLCKDCRGIHTSALTRAASVLVDDLTVRKLLPLLEKVVRRTGMKMIDYE